MVLTTVLVGGWRSAPVLGYAARQHKQEAELMDAVTDGDETAVQELLDSGSIDVKEISTCDDEGSTPLHVAAFMGYTRIVSQLLEAGAPTNAKGQLASEPLHVAAYAGRLQVVQQLIAAGANIEATDEEDRRPLHIAASRGHADIVEALCAAGASTVAVTEDGTSALQAAQRNGHTHVEAALLSGRM